MVNNSKVSNLASVCTQLQSLLYTSQALEILTVPSQALTNHTKTTTQDPLNPPKHPAKPKQHQTHKNLGTTLQTHWCSCSPQT